MNRTLAEALADCLQRMTDGSTIESRFRLGGQPVALAEATEL